MNSAARKYKANFLDVCDFPHLKKSGKKDSGLLFKNKKKAGKPKNAGHVFGRVKVGGLCHDFETEVF